MYYTFNNKCDFHTYTIKDVALIIAQYNPIQLVIDDNCVWNNLYDNPEIYDQQINEFSDKRVNELWVSFRDDSHSIVKITTWENGDGT